MGRSTLEHLGQVLRALAEVVAQQNVNVVLVAGDVFDTAAPSAEAYATLGLALRQIIAAGAQVILTSGNHDSAVRLGYLADFTASSGLHIVTDPAKISQPITISDEHGPVHFFGIPFLEPILIRHLAPDAELVNQQSAIQWALGQIKSVVPPGERSVVISHTFAIPGIANLDAAIERADTSDTTAPLEMSTMWDVAQDALSAPRDFTQGGVDAVSCDVFHGITYTALGHLHGRKQLSHGVRYSGAPLFYSFGEVGRKRGAWLVELNQASLGEVEWVDLPIPRQISQIEGNLAHLLGSSSFAGIENHWVKAVITDNTRQVEAMRQLQTRYPYCVELTHQPAEVATPAAVSYSERVKSRTDTQIAHDFLGHVRNGEGPTAAEQALLAEAIAKFEQLSRQ